VRIDVFSKILWIVRFFTEKVEFTCFNGLVNLKGGHMGNMTDKVKDKFEDAKDMAEDKWDELKDKGEEVKKEADYKATEAKNDAKYGEDNAL